MLAQTPSLKIPNESKCTYEELLDFITPKAAEILIHGIRNRLFIPDPNRPHIASLSTGTGRPLRHAPKITTEDRHIDWTKWRMEDILRRDRVLGRLWTFCQPKGKPKTRIVLEGLENVTQNAPDFWWSGRLNTLVGGTYFQPTGNTNSPYDHIDLGKFSLLPVISAAEERLSIPCVEHGDAIVMLHRSAGSLLVREITVEGGKKKSAAKALAELAGSSDIEIDHASKNQ